MKIPKFNFPNALSEEDLFAADDQCVFCGSHDLKNVHKLQPDPEVVLRECANCHACMASRIPRPHALDASYEHTRSGESEVARGMAQ